MSSTNTKQKYVFYALGIISVALILLTGIRNCQIQREGDKSRKQLADSIDSLKNTSIAIVNMSKEALRVGSLNTQLQEQLLEQSKTITSLSKQSIKTAIGGNSFCYIAMFNPTPDGWLPVVIHVGKYPLYDVQARVVDIEKAVSTNGKSLSRVLFKTDIFLQLGNIAEHEVQLPTLDYIKWDASSKHSYNIFYGGRNGMWTQILRIRNINGQWVQATRVDRVDGAKSTKIYENIPINFPRNKDGGIN